MDEDKELPGVSGLLGSLSNGVVTGRIYFL